MQTLILTVSMVAGLVVLAGCFFYLLGRSTPETHTARIEFTVARSRETAWAALTDYAALPRWWPAVTAIRFETLPGGEVITWNTDKRGHEIGFRTKEESAPARLVREIVGEDLPFGGTWTFELAEGAAGQTRIALTEDGYIRPPLFRGIARIFMKPEGTMNDFARHFAPYVAGR